MNSADPKRTIKERGKPSPGCTEYTISEGPHHAACVVSDEALEAPENRLRFIAELELRLDLYIALIRASKGAEI
jgi:hypothetical protein